MRGGYQIIDLKHFPFESEVSATIDGIYSTIESSRKTIMISNFVYGTEKHHDSFVSVSPIDGGYELCLVLSEGNCKFVVKPDDRVTFYS